MQNDQTYAWLKEDVEKAAALAKEIRRDLHQHPELSGQEVRTVSRVCEELEKLGIEYRVMDDIHAVVGIIRSGREGKTVALRADMDALPIQESTGLPFASEVPGVMHACGHDAHTAILLGAASVLSSHRDQFSGNIKLFFQPSEESKGGAKPMIERGCMEDPYVEATFGLHVSPSLPVGKLSSRSGVMHAGSDLTKIDVYGRSCHGAHPTNGVDAIWIAARIVEAVYALQARRTSPTESLLLNIGRIHGGSANNIVCDHVEMGVSFRFLQQKTRDRICDELTQLVEKTAESLGGRGVFTCLPGYIPQSNSPELFERFKHVAENVMGKDAFVLQQNPSMGSEDFAFFGENRPSVFFSLGTGCAEGHEICPLHSTGFTIDEEAFRHGILMHCALALDYLNN